MIPVNAKKKLTDIGWIFESQSRVPIEIKSKLLSMYPNLLKDDDEEETYRAKELIIDVLNDGCGIEQIYVRDYTADKKNISLIAEFLDADLCIEFFIP